MSQSLPEIILNEDESSHFFTANGCRVNNLLGLWVLIYITLSLSDQLQMHGKRGFSVLPKFFHHHLLFTFSSSFSWPVTWQHSVMPRPSRLSAFVFSSPRRTNSPNVPVQYWLNSVTKTGTVLTVLLVLTQAVELSAST